MAPDVSSLVLPIPGVSGHLLAEDGAGKGWGAGVGMARSHRQGRHRSSPSPVDVASAMATCITHAGRPLLSLPASQPAAVHSGGRAMQAAALSTISSFVSVLMARLALFTIINSVTVRYAVELMAGGCGVSTVDVITMRWVQGSRPIRDDPGTWMNRGRVPSW